MCSKVLVNSQGNPWSQYRFRPILLGEQRHMGVDNLPKVAI